MQLNPHFSDLLSEFNAARVRYLVVGAHVLSYYGRPRTTGDLDIWVEPSPENAERVLGEFGAPLEGVSPEDFWTPGTVFQIGIVPSRIDVLTSITGVTFPTAWRQRKRGRYGELPISLLSERDFIRNKRAVGQTRDLADAEEVELLLAHRTKRRGRRR
ncbi:MAG TPA: hypothetical protein VGQ75_01530 [Thermoanaerobaculia bacterium]|nr:hypothetical protein [Thermoanaerobaculia bacterium]